MNNILKMRINKKFGVSKHANCGLVIWSALINLFYWIVVI